MSDDLCSALSYNALYSNDTMTAMYCASEDYPDCLGICPDQDLAGIGVRAAFYLQSLMNAFSVIQSPEEAAQDAWSSTILTCALIIPAMIQKLQGSLTLYHATLILNFATLSTVASLCVAPLVQIWRRGKKFGPPSSKTNHKTTLGGLARKAMKVKREREKGFRGRIALSVALLVQIILQWSWSILMFVHPYYAQVACSPSTKLVLFGFVLEADEINSSKFGLWAVWLLFSLFGSLTWGIILVFSAPSEVHDLKVHIPKPKPEDHWKIWKKWYHWLKWHVVSMLPHRDEHYKTRIAFFASKIGAFTIVIMYIIVSEVQISRNNVLPGEHELWSFSQMAAILLALAPAWSIASATFKKKSEKSYLPYHLDSSSTLDASQSSSAPQPSFSMPVPYQSTPTPPLPLPRPKPNSVTSLVTFPIRPVVASVMNPSSRPSTPPQDTLQRNPLPFSALIRSAMARRQETESDTGSQDDIHAGLRSHSAESSTFEKDPMDAFSLNSPHSRPSSPSLRSV